MPIKFSKIILSILCVSIVLSIPSQAKVFIPEKVFGEGRRSAAIFSPSGRYLATMSMAGLVTLWEVESGNLINKFLVEVYSGYNHPIDFSKDESSILTTDGRGTICLWDIYSHTMMRAYLPKNDSHHFRFVSFSPDNTKVLGGGWEGLYVWEKETAGILFEIQPIGDMNVAVFSPDGKSILTAGTSENAILWDVSTQKEIRSYNHGSVVECAAFSPDGKCILTGDWHHTAKLWELESGNLLHTYMLEDVVRSVSFSPDGKQILAGDHEHVYLWNLSTHEKEFTFEREEELDALFSPDGKYLLIDDLLWNLESKKIVHSFQSKISHVHNAVYSPEGDQVLVSCSKYPGNPDDFAILYNIDSEKEIHTFILPTNIHHATFSPNGKYILSVGYDEVGLWEIETKRKIHTFIASDAIFSPNSDQLFFSTKETAILWDIHNQQEIYTFVLDHEIQSICFSSDGNFVIAGGDSGTTKIWNASSGHEIYTFDFGSTIHSIDSSPDGKLLLITGNDTEEYNFYAKIWDIDSGRMVHSFHQENSDNGAEFSGYFAPDGTQIMTVYGGMWIGFTITLWDLFTEKISHRLAPVDWTNEAIFSPDGKLILTAQGMDSVGRAYLYDTRTGKEIEIYKHSLPINSVDFSPDGEHIITGSSDGTVKLWNISQPTSNSYIYDRYK